MFSHGIAIDKLAGRTQQRLKIRFARLVVYVISSAIVSLRIKMKHSAGYPRGHAEMRAVIQRVSRASVVMNGETVGGIEGGLLVLLGVGQMDTPEDAIQLARKTAHLRIFDDLDGKMNRSVLDVHGKLLVISQFTLYADCRKGRRPSFVDAARPEMAKPLYEAYIAEVRRQGVPVETGMFQTVMDVALVNHGPVTIILDSQQLS
jgi:D-aminoacyl-tRNA deacylase